MLIGLDHHFQAISPRLVDCYRFARTDLLRRADERSDPVNVDRRSAIQRQLDNALVLDHLADRSVFRLKDHSRGFHLDGLRQLTHLQSEIDPGFLLDFEVVLIACGAVARFVFLEAETTKVISVVAATKEIRTTASELRRLSRDKERFTLFPAVKLLVESCGNKRFMALSLLVNAWVTEFLIKSGQQDYYRVDFGSIEIVGMGEEY